MVSEITFNFAVEMANKLHKHGTPMGLAIYKAAKYYRIDQHELAVEIGRHSVAHQVRPKCHDLKSQVKHEQAYWWDR